MVVAIGCITRHYQLDIRCEGSNAVIVCLWCDLFEIVLRLLTVDFKNGFSSSNEQAMSKRTLQEVLNAK